MIRKILGWAIALLAVIALGLWVWWPKGLVISGPFLDFLTGKQVGAPSEAKLKSRFKLPDGFRIGVFAADVPHARMMQVTDTGDIIVSSMREGNIILLYRDDNGDGMADGRTLLMTGLNTPHGLAVRDGYLYVAETNQIIRAPFDAAARTVGAVEVIFKGLPEGGNHRSRTIAFGPDGWLYVTTGSSCNVCVEDHPYRATMLRMRADGSDAGIYATGLRNSVGFDWQPATGLLFATDNGRDLLGDDTPNCELNLIVDGGDYGWPYAYDDRVEDPDFGPGNEERIKRSRGPVHGFGAHRAPLGIHFLAPGLAPEGFEGAALVAEHGSWNRHDLAGYKVVSLHFHADGSIEERDFLTGFEEKRDVIGRPVDVAQGPDGAIYVSDDYAGAVYRIGWGDMAVAGSPVPEKARAHPLAGLDPAERSALRAEGSVLFEDNGCPACHIPGMADTGDVAAKELKNLAGRYDIDGIAELFLVPPGPMPSFEGLSAHEKRALAVFLLDRDKVK